ncbi:MAG TPA: hypothetical protein P5107_07185 [Thermotogota bacterium]|nr:hypothetical protein [Thermotogota bacterium]HRW34822.1 hypothetical protein [Thermotogota bacterium]
MKSKTAFLFIILLIIIALGLTSCMNDRHDPIPDPYLSLEELKAGFFRNGKILHAFDNPQISMFSLTDKIGVRILKQTSTGYNEDYSCLEFLAISENSVSFKNIFYTSESSKTISIHDLTNEQTLDLNGDEIWDIRFSGTDTTFSQTRNLNQVVFLELNNSPQMSVTFRFIPVDDQKNHPIMAIDGENKICIDEKGLPVLNHYDPGERTIDIDTDTINLEIENGDLFLLGPSYDHSMGCPLKRIVNIEGTGAIKTLELGEMELSEFSVFLKGIKYKGVYRTNPDEPYLFEDRMDEEYILWSGRIDHRSQSEDSNIRIHSHEPVQILLSFMDIDFEMGLNDDLIRFFYHPIFAIRGNITMEVDSSTREIPGTYFFDEPITVDILDIPLSGSIRFGFSTHSEGEGRIDSEVTYQFDDTYYSLRINSQDWDNPSQWLPYADFRRNIDIVSATGTQHSSICFIEPSLHLDGTLSFLNIFKSHQSDLRFGLKFNQFQSDQHSRLDVIPSFELTTEYTIEYLQQERYHFPSRPIYSVELSPYSIY